MAWRRPSPRPGAAGDAGDALGELVRVFNVDREEPVVPGCPAQRPSLAVEPRNPHRHVRPLQRARQKPHAVDHIVLTPVVHGLTVTVYAVTNLTAA